MFLFFLGAALFLDSRPLGPLAGSRIRTGSLPADRQRFSMAKATVTSQIHQSLDVHGDLGSQGTLNSVFIVDDLSNTIYLRF